MENKLAEKLRDGLEIRLKELEAAIRLAIAKEVVAQVAEELLEHQDYDRAYADLKQRFEDWNIASLTIK